MASPDTFVPVASRPPPRSEMGAWAWVRRGFFDGPWNTALTMVVLLKQRCGGGAGGRVRP